MCPDWVLPGAVLPHTGAVNDITKKGFEPGSTWQLCCWFKVSHEFGPSTLKAVTFRKTTEDYPMLPLCPGESVSVAATLKAAS